MSWMHAVMGALEYWFVTTWKGVRLESYDLKKGIVETTYITPDTVVDTLKSEIQKIVSDR